MVWERATHYVAAGALAAGMLVWAAHEAWPSREIPVALPIVVTSAYDEWADTLSRGEILSDVLARGGITGREYVAFLKATHTLNPRRMQPGLIFQLRRLKGTTVVHRLGRILAARVDVAGSPSFAFAFDGPSGQSGFYDDRGRSLRRAFLRAPLRFSHISSRFGGRFHPILRRWRTHEGTDYAAGYGTPVRSTADGVVMIAGRNGGGRNLVGK